MWNSKHPVSGLTARQCMGGVEAQYILLARGGGGSASETTEQPKRVPTHGKNHRISAARKKKGDSSSLKLNLTDPCYTLYSIVPVPRMRYARLAGWVNCFNICTSTMPRKKIKKMLRAQNRVGKGSIILWRRFTFPIFLLFIYGKNQTTQTTFAFLLSHIYYLLYNASGNFWIKLNIYKIFVYNDNECLFFEMYTWKRFSWNDNTISMCRCKH